jgi:serine/threonine-protein kinase
MRNEIYARHGWVFQRTDLQDYFGRQPWYRPKGTWENREAANRLAEAELSPLERQNVKAILQYEKAQGGVNPPGLDEPRVFSGEPSRGRPETSSA